MMDDVKSADVGLTHVSVSISIWLFSDDETEERIGSLWVPDVHDGEGEYALSMLLRKSSAKQLIATTKRQTLFLVTDGGRNMKREKYLRTQVKVISFALDDAIITSKDEFEDDILPQRAPVGDGLRQNS